MLRDRFFYPLAVALIAAMIGFALSLGTTERVSDACIWENGFVARGDDLVSLTASPGTTYEFVGATSANPAHVIMMTEISRVDAPASAGVFAALGPDYERALAGHKLRITVRARQGRKNPLKEFDMGYFTAGAGDSQWQRRQLTEDFQNYSFEFTPNLPTADPDLDYLGIWPGDEGKQETIDVEFMRVDVLTKPVPSKCSSA